MPREVASGAEGEDSVLQGTEIDEGQPDEGTRVEDGQPKETEDVTTQTDGEPTGEEPQKTVTADDLAAIKKDYENLQSAFNKRDDDVSAYREVKDRIDRLGGIDQIEQSYQFITGNPDVLKFLEDYQRKQATGVDTDLSQYDEETQKALKLVDERALKIAQFYKTQLEDSYQKKLDEVVTPLVEAERQRSVETSLKQMDKLYPKWREEQSAMDEMMDDILPEHVQENPSLKDIKYLYVQTLEKQGKYNDFAANIHQERLKDLKKESSDGAPSSQVQKAKGKAKTLKEALAMAEEEHKVKL